MATKNSVKHGDCVGRQLEEGDIVASTAGGYAHLKLFVVVGFTAKKIRVTTFNNESYKGQSGFSGVRAGDVTVRDPQQVCLVKTGDGRRVPELSDQYKKLMEDAVMPF